MKTNSLILLIAIMLSTVATACAQERNTYDVVNELLQTTNAKFPLLDSLYPMHIGSLKRKEWVTLSKKEWKEFRSAIRNAKGMKLVADSVKGRRLIRALPIFQAMSSFDSTSRKIIENQRPFYMMSAPVIFHDSTRAIIFLALIKGFGATYLLEKIGTNWVVIKEVYGWM